MVGKASFYDGSECGQLDCVLMNGYHDYFQHELVEKIEKASIPNIKDVEEYVNWLENLDIDSLKKRNVIDQKKGMYEGWVEEFLIEDYNDYLFAWKKVLENCREWPDVPIYWL